MPANDWVDVRQPRSVGNTDGKRTPQAMPWALETGPLRARIRVGNPILDQLPKVDHRRSRS